MLGFVEPAKKKKKLNKNGSQNLQDGQKVKKNIKPLAPIRLLKTNLKRLKPEELNK